MLDMDLEVGLEPLDERTRLIGSRGVEPAFGAELRQVTGEQIRDLDHRRFVCAPGRDWEFADDCFQRRGFHRMPDGIGAFGANGVLDVAQQNILVAQFPAHHPVVHRAAAVAEAGLGALDLGDPEKFLSELIGRDLEVVLLIDAMNCEEASLRFGLFGDDLVVRLDGFRFFLLIGLFQLVGFLRSFELFGRLRFPRFGKLDFGKGRANERQTQRQ